MEENGLRNKKSFAELLQCLEHKGVRFNITDKDEAYKILYDLNYYYKLTVYKKNFRTDITGKRQELEFSYLVDISRTDRELRYILLEASLDIEHALKTYMIARITDNVHVDGYDIVNRFFQAMKDKGKNIRKEKILDRLKNEMHYQNALYKANQENVAAWVLVEILSFGDFLLFFQYYYEKYPDKDIAIKSLMGLLYSVRNVRNACAHSMTLLHGFRDKQIKFVNKELKSYVKRRGFSGLSYKYLKVYDILAVLYIHEKFVVGGEQRLERVTKLKEWGRRAKERLCYLDDSYDLILFINLLLNVVDKYVI